jgi:NAD(P)H dehydrogenase (quinone)
MKNILIINANPVKNSLSESMAKHYLQAAESAGAQCKLIHLNDLDFDPILHNGYRKSPEMEKDLIQIQQDIKWANHLVLVYPTWWNTYPALLHGFIDRVFTPGFAFKYRENSKFWDKYLTGKSARLIVTMDSPTWYYKLLVGKPGHRAMKKGILEFCGIKPVKITNFGEVKSSTPEQREKWMNKVKELGEQLI